MKLADDIWLGSVAARRNFLHLFGYSSAFYGTAALQGMAFGLRAPRVFWTAIGRVTAPLAVLDDPANAAGAPDTPLAAERSDNGVADTGPSPHLLDAPRGGAPDDLRQITGIGAKLAETLGEFGIYHFDQIATLDEAGLDWLNQQQPGFKALQARFDLIGQARVLAEA